MNFLVLGSLLLISCLAATLGESEPQPHIEIIPNGISGSGITTGYWDCCKPSCSWKGNIKTNTGPVHSCAKDGVSRTSDDAQSGCAVGGKSYMCTNQGPWAVNSTLAYGFSAVSFKGGADYSLCCGCLMLSFTAPALKNKKMVVQYTNTGGDLNVNQFDLALPGAGVGYNTLGCVSQWNAPPNGWGDRYGGVHSKAECSQLPSQLQKGCRFRFEWMESVPVPNVTFVQVKCPADIVKVSGCNLDPK